MNSLVCEEDLQFHHQVQVGLTLKDVFQCHNVGVLYSAKKVKHYIYVIQQERKAHIAD